MITIINILFILSTISMIIGALGLFRFPDIYTRIHAATMITIGGVVLSLIAIAFNPFNLQFSIKILIIASFIVITSPITSHAIVMSAYDNGIKPLVVKDELVHINMKDRKVK
ncbi:MAG: monovalent cation/H(+) antiporter subunit G [DPANN group archaeon]|nr:monovalent cation/H(+) antiporter subunit G [DPANN group archaeon]